MKLFRHKFEIS